MERDSGSLKSVLAFYKFFEIRNTAELREDLLKLGASLELKGTVLVAHEGLNSTLAGNKENLDRFSAYLVERFGDFPFKWSVADESNEVFFRFKVKVKSEIVTMGVDGLNMEVGGTHVSPEEWNDLLLDPEVIVVDARNDYETDIGSFPGAVIPGTTNFREFPGWADQQLDPKKNKRVAMFCTGGIRCEKASAYLLDNGFENVYQLDGGVLKYLETVDDQANQWTGECFVFDQRVSVDARLQQGLYRQCFACRHPLSQDDLCSDYYEEGVSCGYCVDDKSPDRKEQFRQRQKQVKLANQRGEKHLGVNKTSTA